MFCQRTGFEGELSGGMPQLLSDGDELPLGLSRLEALQGVASKLFGYESPGKAGNHAKHLRRTSSH